MKTIVVFVVLLGFVSAELAEFTKCPQSSDDICETLEVRVTPCRNPKSCALKKGKNSSIEFDYIPKFDATNLKSGLFWTTSTGDIPFNEYSDIDACPYTSCPTQSGQRQQYSFSLLPKKILPNGEYMIKLKLWDSSDQKKVCCFLTKIALRK